MTAFFFIENQISALPKSPKMVHLGSDFVLGLGLVLQVVGSHKVDDVAGHVDSGDGFYAAQSGEELTSMIKGPRALWSMSTPATISPRALAAFTAMARSLALSFMGIP